MYNWAVTTDTIFDDVKKAFNGLDVVSKELDATCAREFDTLNRNMGFPPFDVYTEEVDGKTELFIRLAIAGLSKENLTVSFDDEKRLLTVTYKKPETEEKGRKYEHAGIAKRSFKYTRYIEPKFELVRASTAIESGCLVIEFREKEQVDKKHFVEIEG